MSESVFLKSSIKLADLPSGPSLRPESFWARRNQLHLIAGIDEAGRGPLAGPVVAGAVVLRPFGDCAGLPARIRRISGLQDSKLTTLEERERLFDRIRDCSLGWGIGEASPEEIDRINILQATLLAAQRALEQCNECLEERFGLPVQGLVTDALHLKAVDLPQYILTKGDRRSSSVAAASILAKVHRDRLMADLDRAHPGYGLAKHKGYPTKAHYAAIAGLGPSPCHRLTFAGVKEEG